MSLIADAVLFDLDGVLVDSREAFVRSMNAALVAHGAAAREPDTLVRYLGPPLHATFAELMGGEEHVDACVAAYRSRYHDEGFAESVVFDGIPEALDALRAAGLPLVVATSKSVDSAVPLLEALGLAERFIAIIGPAAGVRDETKATTIARALTLLEGARAPVMVGDRRYDVEGAAANGLPCVGALWGIGGEAELRAAGAAVLAETATALPELLLGRAAAA